MKMIGSQMTAQSWSFWKAVLPPDEDVAIGTMRKEGPPAPSLKVRVLASTTHGEGAALFDARRKERKSATAFEHDRRSVSSTSTPYWPLATESGPMRSAAGTFTTAAQRAAPPPPTWAGAPAGNTPSASAENAQARAKRRRRARITFTSAIRGLIMRSVHCL